MALACPACGLEEFQAGWLIGEFRVKTCRACRLQVLVDPERRNEGATLECSKIKAAEYQ